MTNLGDRDFFDQYMADFWQVAGGRWPKSVTCQKLSQILVQKIAITQKRHLSLFFDEIKYRNQSGHVSPTKLRVLAHYNHPSYHKPYNMSGDETVFIVVT